MKVSIVMSGLRWVSATTVATVRPVVRSTAARIAVATAGFNGLTPRVHRGLVTLRDEHPLRERELDAHHTKRHLVVEDGDDALARTVAAGGADAAHLLGDLRCCAGLVDDGSSGSWASAATARASGTPRCR